MRQLWPRTLLALAALAALALPGGALADQSSQPASPAAGRIATGEAHSCVVLSAAVRCWGFGGNGRLGYGNVDTIGDDETPAGLGPIALGGPVDAISADGGHACALLEVGSVRCWGFAGNGRLGYGNTNSIGDDETPASAGAVDLGAGRTATAISAGESHTCAVLDDGSVRCWGYGAAGQLGYANNLDVGDNETPGTVAPVDLGAGRTATAIATGASHTCALLDDGHVRCWGFGSYGQLGLGTVQPTGDTLVGDDEKPSAVPTVDLGTGRTATAIAAGSLHTCAVLDDASVRCWGFGANGQLGHGNLATIGDNESVASAGPVPLPAGRGALAISAGRQHTCALLDDGSVSCWGGGSFGQLGRASQASIGDDEPASAAGPIDLGPGAKAVAIASGPYHTCALLADASVRCWGYGSNGRLGYCSQANVGDDETPAAVGPVDLGAGGAACASAAPAPGGSTTLPSGGATAVPAAAEAPTATYPPVDPLAVERARAERLRACLRAAARRPRAARKTARRQCLLRHGRTPGRVTRLRARALRTKVVLSFAAPASDGKGEPASRRYLVRQSLRPIRSARAFARAPALCRGSCRFSQVVVGGRLTLTVTGLRPRTTYYYAVAARDNVSNRLGPRSATVRVRTR